MSETLFADAYFDTMPEALAEVRRRKGITAAAAWLTRVVESPYAGYRVVSLPVELMLDDMTDAPVFSAGRFGSNPLIAR